ncbi:GNAT family N-acetyltransferase [Methylosinus sp. H3A]|uniref:GNAT family N-acetyltransferase n=1 Tax=Methylosinus sp. H3A TaxID=2785786 RepID=UPI0018C2101F|nr:GNAT family N-acetyltransferase [Methylosinus sp. H3A]MBG0812255.1 GNAT family N-acetyltransferase [Methylosinus sp. H3A]
MCFGEKSLAPAIPILETPRLSLQPLSLSDVDAVQLGFPHWETVRFMSRMIPWPYPHDGALTYIRDVALPAMEKGRAWHWSIRRREAPDRLVGVISLMEGPDENRGFWLAREWRKRGFATEAAEAATDYWFETLERPILRVPKAVANIPSRRISEKAGMRIIASCERDYVSGRLPAEIWEITREEWRARPR